MKNCSICRLKAAALINEALQQGHGLGTVVKRFSLPSKATLGRHRQKCLGLSGDNLPPPPEPPPPEMGKAWLAMRAAEATEPSVTSVAQESDGEGSDGAGGDQMVGSEEEPVEAEERHGDEQEQADGGEVEADDQEDGVVEEGDDVEEQVGKEGGENEAAEIEKRDTRAHTKTRGLRAPRVVAETPPETPRDTRPETPPNPSRDDQIVTPTAAILRGRPDAEEELTTGDQRVEHIAWMIARGRWRGSTSMNHLSKKWGIARKSVRDYFRLASIVTRLDRGDLEQQREVSTGVMRSIRDECRRKARDSYKVAQAARESSKGYAAEAIALKAAAEFEKNAISAQTQLDRIQGIVVPPRPSIQVNILQSPEFGAVMAAVQRGLEGYPEARARVVAEVREALMARGVLNGPVLVDGDG